MVVIDVGKTGARALKGGAGKTRSLFRRYVLDIEEIAALVEGHCPGRLLLQGLEQPHGGRLGENVGNVDTLTATKLCTKRRPVELGVQLRRYVWNGNRCGIAHRRMVRAFGT